MKLLQSLSRAASARIFAAALVAAFAATLPAEQGALAQAAKSEAAKSEAKGKSKAEAKGEFVPQSGQPGKDVVWVPTPQALVDRMLDMARVTKDDYVIDLGSGDGRTVITAAKRGVKAKGIEYNPDMVELSKRNAEKEGVAGQVEFVRGDIFETDFSDATVVTLFLLPSLNVKLRPTILKMRPGTRVVSNSFDMGDWEPDETIQAGGDCTSWCRAHFWMVPADVNGAWKMGEGELKLEQKYQMLSGTLENGATSAPVTGKMVGDRIYFTAGRALYEGQVSDGKIEGTVHEDGETKPWEVTR